MSENDSTSLDLEFKRYLQIMRPYLGQLLDHDVIEICNAWIQRLSNCSENEKAMRNKYVFALCYQLAKGILEDPFLNYPPDSELQLIVEEEESESSTEVEYMVINAEEPNTKVLFNNKKPTQSETEYQSQEDDEKRESSRDFESNKPVTPSIDKSCRSARKQTILCYTCPEMLRGFNNASDEQYEFRANNLIMKLREIKKQNMLLHNELLALKEESKHRSDDDSIEETEKVDNATSAIHNESDITLKSLKSKLQEVQETRNSLLATISALQDQIDNLNELKKHEIDDLEAKHQLEVIKVKAATREECKQIYEDRLEELTKQYEKTVLDIQRNIEIEIQNQTKTKDEIINNHDKLIREKDAMIHEKDTEITNLKARLEEQKSYLQSVLSKFVEKPNEDLSSESMRFKAQELEKRLNRMEKSKVKCAKTYEAKLALVQREKHLAECSLQLQLVRQRAQVVNEIADENQAEISTAIEKLETKYKDIVANVQATAIQRRMQDQMALEAILHAACGNNNDLFGSKNHLSGKATLRNHKDPNQSYDSDLSGLIRNKIGKNSFEGDTGMPKFCLDSEGLEELFQKVYIPQRDTGDGLLKK